jgi:hypothetical protein
MLMRVAILPLIGLLLTSCGDETHKPSNVQPLPWSLRDDKANIAVLLVDYETYAFEGANISYYPLCVACDTDSLPFEMRPSHPGGMFSYCAFIYTETGDTLFYSSVVWMADGQIYCPRTFLEPDKFEAQPDSVALPGDFQQFGHCIFISDEECMVRVTRAWEAVSSLDVVHAFAQHPYKVGFYLYPRWGSVFSPSEADWVIFLYRGKVAT